MQIVQKFSICEKVFHAWNCGIVKIVENFSTCGNVEMWKCGNVEMWKCGNVEMWKCGHVDMWKCGHVEMWKL